MPVRTEPRRRPQQDRKGRLREDTVVDLSALVEALVPETRHAKAASKTKRAEAFRRTQSARPPRPPKRRERRKTRLPVQDAAAFFDASRCDFATLVKTLDEVLGKG